MHYMLLVYHREDAWQARPVEERQAIYQRCLDHNRKLADDGVFLDGAPLESVATAETVRVRNGETLVTDGPFAETKEQLGGYFLLDCANRAEAREHAADIIEKQQNAFGGMEIRESPEAD